MAEEKNNEEKTEAAADEKAAAEEEPKQEETVEAAEEAPAEEAPAEETPAEEQQGDEEPPAEEEQPEEEPAAEPEPGAEDSAGSEEELTPKQRRRLERSRASGPPGPQLTPEQRAEQRAERRGRAAEQRQRHRRRRREKRGEPGTGTPPAERRPGTRKVRQGTVVSTRSPKTITVRVELKRRHTTYEKVVRRSGTLRAHDESGEANEGDVVRVVESRPLSRTKRWRLLEVVERAR
jgi:small subunit ribosomal protein S17